VDIKYEKYFQNSTGKFRRKETSWETWAYMADYVINIDPKEKYITVWAGFVCSLQGSVTDSHKHENKPTGSINGGKFPDQLSAWHLVKENFMKLVCYLVKQSPQYEGDVQY
jgi:hypothetical protein